MISKKGFSPFMLSAANMAALENLKDETFLTSKMCCLTFLLTMCKLIYLVCTFTAATGKAFTFPLFTKFAHRLFPQHVCLIFDECSHEELERLSEALQRESWVFGYWTVLKNRFGLKGCEVKLQSFIDCNLLQQMPLVMQDALRVYDALSRIIRKDGHTYVQLWKLKGKATNVTKWAENLAYLEEINIVKTSAAGDSRHVFLTHIRGFEKTIARNLAEIMDNEPWVGDIEIDEQVSIA